MKRVILVVIVLSQAASLFSQGKITLSGFVYDKSSGEILIGANVYEKHSRLGTVSNEYGFYSFTFKQRDSMQVIASFLGYEPKSIDLFPGSGKQINFYLQATSSLLDEVTISAGKKENIVTRNETGVIRLSMKEIETLPNLFGEVDIIKAFQLTPGVQSGGEARSNLYVRGGSPDQNLFLLDDVPLYYVAHFGGFFSVFNADAINDVKLIKGGFPARYGSRLSSILDIRMKEGNMQKLTVQGTVGVLSSKVSIEAPIVKDKMSFIISARKNLLPIFKMMGTGMSYNFYDLNAKLNWRLSEKDKLFLSFYMGDDNLSIGANQDSVKTNNSILWGNKLISFRWNHVYNNKLFSNLTLSNTNFRNRNIFEYSIEKRDLNKDLYSSLLSGINDLSLKIDYTYLLNSIFSLRFGGNSIYHAFNPNDEIYSQSGIGIETINRSYADVTKALENALYVESELKYNRVSMNAGVRLSSYHTEKSYYSLEPRFLINFLVREDLSVKYSYSRMNQYVHLLAYSGTGIPNDYWMPTNENVKPETSVQNSFAIAKTMADGMYELSLEAYYKTLDNQITFIPGESLMGNLGSWENVVEKEGTGKNYGIELFIQKLEGKTTGWIGATLSRAERTFKNLNNGQSFPFKYDRLLDISIVLNQKLKKNVVLSATWTYGTGYPITLAMEHYYNNGEDIFIYKGINSFKMRDYHRLDVAINFPKKVRWGEGTWSISIFNLYNRQNPYYYYYKRDSTPTIVQSNGGIGMTSVEGELRLYQRSLFSIFPSISYSFKF